MVNEFEDNVNISVQFFVLFLFLYYLIVLKLINNVNFYILGYYLCCLVAMDFYNFANI